MQGCNTIGAPVNFQTPAFITPSKYSPCKYFIVHDFFQATAIGAPPPAINIPLHRACVTMVGQRQPRAAISPRYQYLSLVFFLEYSQWPGVPKVTDPTCAERYFKSPIPLSYIHSCSVPTHPLVSSDWGWSLDTLEKKKSAPSAPS